MTKLIVNSQTICNTMNITSYASCLKVNIWVTIKTLTNISEFENRANSASKNKLRTRNVSKISKKKVPSQYLITIMRYGHIVHFVFVLKNNETVHTKGFGIWRSLTRITLNLHKNTFVESCFAETKCLTH